MSCQTAAPLAKSVRHSFSMELRDPDLFRPPITNMLPLW